MRTMTLKEKWTLKWNEFVRMIKIITENVMFAIILGIIFGAGLIIRDNNNMKNQITEMEKQMEDSREEVQNDDYYVIEGHKYYVITR